MIVLGSVDKVYVGWGEGRECVLPIPVL